MSETPPIIPSVNTSPLPPNREMMRLLDMLDERGIEYNKTETDSQEFTYWEHEGRCWGYWVDCIGDTSLITVDVTPEQAIDATVGVGTCKLVDNDSGPDMHCTACGGEVDDEYRYFMDSLGYSRCPHCGARIIEEETE